MKIIVLTIKQSDSKGAGQNPPEVMMLNHLQVIRAESHAAALRFLKDNPCDLILYTVCESESNLEETQNFLREAGETHKLPIVIMTPENHPSQKIETLVTRLQESGPVDLVTGMAENMGLFKFYDRLLSNRTALPARAFFLKWGKGYQFQGMVGRSPGILKVFSAIERLAPYNTTVLISGETGTGKEMVARAIHNLSPRRSRRFVACNCAALPETLLESELFGHVKGAFTGAIQKRDGLFVHSNGGTIFLDEIGDMPLPFQAKLLRTIEDHEIRPVGSDNIVSVDVRIVVATNVNLWEAVQSGRFRKDLFYRLNVARVEMPPLCERTEDIPILCEYFLEEARRKNRLSLQGCSAEAGKLLMLYDWPGNVREFKNTLEAAAVMATGDQLAICDLPPSLQEYAISHQEKLLQSTDRPNSLEEREKRHIEEVISRCQGNKTIAARELGLSRRALYRRLEKYQFSA